MPSADKQKKQKEPSRQAKKVMTRKVYRAQRHANVAYDLYMRNLRPDLFLAKVTHLLGGSRFRVQGMDKTTYEVGLKGTGKISRRASHNDRTRVAVFVGKYVLTDGAHIYSVLGIEEAGRARSKLGMSEHSRSGSAKSIFSYGAHSVNSLGEKLAARKASHKATKKVNRSGSAAGSVVASVASSAGSATSDVLLVAGKKVYDPTGQRLHGEALRQAKRELAATAKAAK
jgi:hypothetical protein